MNGLTQQYLNLWFHHGPPCQLQSKGAGSLVVPRIMKNTAGAKPFFFRLPQLWNRLPISAQDSLYLG